MKNSKKILAFLLSAFMVCAVPTVVSACNNDNENPPPVEQPTEPSKVKDGTDISVAVGDKTTIKVSEYITANGKTVTANSSNTEVASAELKDGVVTVTGKAKGTATIKLKCESVEVSFNLTVTEEVKNTPAPVFENATAALDLRLNGYAEVELAPKSGGDKFDFVYSLANSLVSGAEITEGKLKFTPTETGRFEILIAVKCTEKDNADNVYNLTFNVTVTVTRSQEEKVYFKVSVDGTETQVEQGVTFTLPEFTGTVPEGKEFDGWKIGEEKKNAGDTITVTGNVTVVSVFKNKVYTVTVDGGEPRSVEHGTKITLPAEKEVEAGKQFMGWTDGTNNYAAGSEITVTRNLTITAIIENIPDTPPELVKGTDSIVLVLDSEDNAATLNIADYVTTNGNAFKVDFTDREVISVNSSLTAVTVTALKFGSSTVTITCGSLTVTITVTVKYPPSQVKEDVVTDTEIHDLFAGGLVLDLAENVTYSEQVTGYKVNGADVEGSTFNVTGEYGETESEVTFTVTVLFGDADPLEYTYKVKVKDTTAYRIVNGGFDEWDADGKPVGWTVTDGYGSEQTALTYWAEERPFDNVGSYFGETTESKTGVLQTNTFKVGNSGWVSFQLGSANPDKAIWVEIFDVTENKVIAKFKNVNWSDPENAQRLIPYKVNLSEFRGDSVYIKITDDADNKNGYATFFADSFNSWHDEEPTVITLADGGERTYVNLGAPVFEDLTASVDLKDANKAEVTLPAAVWGVIGTDYTYATATEGASISEDGTKLVFTAVKSGVFDVIVTGTTAFGSADFKVTVTVTNTKERPEIEDTLIGQINIDSDNLSLGAELSEGDDNFALSYAIKTPVEGASISEDGKEFIYTAAAGQSKGTVEVTLTVTFTDKVYAQDVYTKDVIVSIEIVGDDPEIKEATVTKEVDLNGNDSVEVSLNLAANVTIPSSVTVTYSVNDTDVDGSVYTATLNKGTHNLTVKVHYGDGSELEYAYIVKVAQYTVINGDFEKGTLDGWVYTVADGSTDFGRIDNETSYWVGKDGSRELNKQGEWLFTGVETDESKGKVNLESGKGTLKSSAFTLKQNGWISFLMGGAHNVNCGVRIRAVSDDSILAEFNNQGKGVDAVMDRYIYKFTGMQADTDCYIEVFDDAEGGWGLVAVDDFKTDWGGTKPDYENAKEIVPYFVKGQIANGGFATGDLSGWTVLTDGMTGGVINSDTYWGERLPFNNSGSFLSGFDTGIAEGGTWAIRSSTVTLQGSGWMSVKMGGHAAAVKVFKADGTPIGEYRANHFSDTNFPFVNDDHSVGGSWADMRTYFIDLHDHIGEEIYIELHDIAVDGWAHAFFDEVVTYYESAPDIDNGFDTVTSPVSIKSIYTDDEGKEIKEYNYGEVQLKWRLAEKEN